MADRFRLTLAQLNPTVGALDANADMVRAAWATAKARSGAMPMLRASATTRRWA